MRAIVLFACFAAAAAGQNYTFEEGDHALALKVGDKTVWRFHWGSQRPVPYFHPVALTDGTVLTSLGPSDHPHHHALWFAWDKLNGVDYWSEPNAGRTEVVKCDVVKSKDGGARFQMAIEYKPPSKQVVLSEKRTIVVRRPDAEGRYTIDWRGEFTAGSEPVLLKGGVAGGGYAGMSVRIAQDSTDWRLIDSEGRVDIAEGEFARNTHGQRARWMDFSLVNRATGSTGGIAILEHPTSFRHPSQWHNLINPRQPFGYFSPATLWSEPYTLAARGKLTVYYRILVHPGRGDRPALERDWQLFARER